MPRKQKSSRKALKNSRRTQLHRDNRDKSATSVEVEEKKKKRKKKKIKKISHINLNKIKEIICEIIRSNHLSNSPEPHDLENYLLQISPGHIRWGEPTSIHTINRKTALIPMGFTHPKLDVSQFYCKQLLSFCNAQDFQFIHFPRNVQETVIYLSLSDLKKLLSFNDELDHKASPSGSHRFMQNKLRKPSRRVITRKQPARGVIVRRLPKRQPIQRPQTSVTAGLSVPQALYFQPRVAPTPTALTSGDQGRHDHSHSVNKPTFPCRN